MRNLLGRLLLVIFLVVSVSWLAHAHGGDNFTVNEHENVSGEDCDRHFDISSDLPLERTQEDRTIAPNSISKLRISGLQNGGIQVVGWERDEIFVRACKAAAASNRSEAKSTLDHIKLEVRGGDVTVSGLERRQSWVHLLVRVPKQIAMEVETHNGPLSLRGISAKALDARAVNGPVSLQDCIGKIVVEVQNGPVSLVRSSGDIRLRAQNGPMSVELDKAWQGEGLEASTRNGPLELRIPERYGSGVEVRADGHSPFACELDACQGATKDWENNSRSVRFGQPGQATIVRLSTVNGPVSIERARRTF
jgi:DUF4097 and DUF4098 domain-containing protein YvlB